MNAANMDLAYGNAYLTICAADGMDTNEGLAALNPKVAEITTWAEYSKENPLTSREAIREHV